MVSKHFIGFNRCSNRIINISKKNKMSPSMNKLINLASFSSIEANLSSRLCLLKMKNVIKTGCNDPNIHQ